MAERFASVGFPMDFHATGADYLHPHNHAKNVLETFIAPPLALGSLPFNAVVGLISMIDTRSVPFSKNIPSPLFRQSRSGLEWQDLEVWKWRTMRGEHTTTQGVDDDRASNVGNLLRTSSLDEMPGLVQAALGELALIGPRPRLEVDYDRMKKVSPETYEFWLTNASPLAIKAGLFSRAASLGHEIGGQSPELDLKTMLLDILYLENASIKEDIAIIASTPKSLLRGGRRTVVNICDQRRAKKQQNKNAQVQDSAEQQAA